MFDGKIFVLGGRSDEGEVLKKVEFFDPVKNEWENFNNLEEEREALGAVVLDGTMFAIGGFGGDDDNERLLQSVEFYDPNQGKWFIFDSWQLEVARASLVSVTVNDSAFSIGGFSNLGPLGFVQRYHSLTGPAQRRELLTPRGGLAATVNKDTIFVMGGQDPSIQVISAVEFFIPSQNRWQQALSLNTPRAFFAAVTANNQIYVFGGLDANGRALASVEAAAAFDIVTSVSVAEPSVPIEFTLKQNYPNPFNAGTKITFQISQNPGGSRVKLAVYNVQGQLITILVNEKLMPGEYEVFWDGTDQKGIPVASGIYIYTLNQGQNKETKKMTLVR